MMTDEQRRIIGALQRAREPNPQRRRVANPKPKAQGEPMHPPSRSGYDTVFAFCLGVVIGTGGTTIVALVLALMF